MQEDKKEKNEKNDLKEAVEEISPQEKRIRAITRIYYSKPEVQKALLEFSKNREVVPRYFEGFGKRPDTLLYPSDVINLVNRGATSFHASEELWRDPLSLRTEMSPNEFHDLRIGWDLLIDIDSPYLDYSKIAAHLVCTTLEKYGIKSYGIKFSGNKGMHIIVPSAAFPSLYRGSETRAMFPDWPRAITEFLLFEIKPSYNKQLIELGINFEALEKRTKFSKEDLIETRCPNCGKPSKKVLVAALQCTRCKSRIERSSYVQTKRKLKCIEPSCPGYYEIKEQHEYDKCESCGFSSYDKHSSSENKIVYSREMKRDEKYSEFNEELAAEKLGSLDLVLVSPRHLFRMPYSLHEKTALASIILSKENLFSFTPKDADPFKARPALFYPSPIPGEAEHLLEAALDWKQRHQEKQDKTRSYNREAYEAINPEGINEEMFPAPIKKLLKGIAEGRKRGLFILITFLRALNFPSEAITSRVYEWNKKNTPPLKEGYVKSQLEWHTRQKRKIMPPNYDNASFYKDLGLMDKQPMAKNPIAEVVRTLHRKTGYSQGH